MDKIIPIEHSGQRVLTTAQLAELKNLPKCSSHFKRIYVIESFQGMVKIGVSRNAYTRIRSISTMAAIDIKRVALSDECVNSRVIEKELHVQFESGHIKGEWFNISFEECLEAMSRKKLDKTPPPKSDVDADFLIKYFRRG